MIGSTLLELSDTSVWLSSNYIQTGRILYRVKYDWESVRFGFQVRPTAPNPCVFRFGELNDDYTGDASVNGHYTKLPREWQFFMLDLASFVVFGCYSNALTADEYKWLANKFTSVCSSGIAFFNNGNGFDICRNYLLGERLDVGDPAIYTLVCGGNAISGTVVKNIRGESVLQADYFDGTKPPPPIETIDPYADPRVFFANIVNNNQRVYRFSQYEGKDVAIPIIASRPIYFPLIDLEECTEKPIPYR